MKNSIKAALLFLTLTVFNLQAQNYSPFIYDNASYFQFEDRIEALQEEPGYVYDHRGYAIYLQQAWNLNPVNGCNPHNQPTWAGPKYILAYIPNTYYFFNKNDEAILFKPMKNVGETWTMYTYSNGDYIEATISNKEQVSFLTLTDSVKTISLQRKNSGGTVLIDEVNNIVYKVSKNYGLIQLTRFLNFPTAGASGDLIGLTAPEKGFQLISSREIFNFDIGDEFHYDSLYQSNFLNLVQHINTINSVTAVYRSVNTDTVIYTFDQQKHIHSLNTQTLEETDEYSSGTVKQKYILSKKQLYPGQANLGTEKFLDGAPYWLTLFPDDATRSQWNTNGEWFRQAFNEPNCWGEFAYDPVHSYQYLEGCGLLENYQHAWGAGWPARYKRLVYFKKGQQQWGDALIVTSSTKKGNVNFTLFPNPLKQGELLHFNAPNFNVKQVFVYHVTGTKVLESSDDVSPIKSLDLSGIQPGLYLVQLVDEKNERVSQQLLIK